MTGEQPAVTITDRAPVRTDGKTLVAIVALAISLAGGWFTLKASVADLQARIFSLESSRARTDAAIADQAVTNRGVADELAHIRETTDQTARDVRELQQRRPR